MEKAKLDKRAMGSEVLLLGGGTVLNEDSAHADVALLDVPAGAGRAERRVVTPNYHLYPSLRPHTQPTCYYLFVLRPDKNRGPNPLL